MTNREKELLQILKENPMISQNDLADMLNITRSSIGVHISNLIRKGYIKGKGYILDEQPYCCVIGGANMDIQCFPKLDLVYHDSNPGNMKLSSGGVGRNIAENMIRLGIRTKLITVLGDDLYANAIIDEAKSIGLEIEDSLFLDKTNSSTYFSVLNKDGDLEIAIASMDIYDSLTDTFIKKKEKIIQNSRIVIIDTNIPESVIEFIVKTYKNTIFFLDTVSTAKSVKIKDLLGYFHTIKPNKIEAEKLSGIQIKSDKDLHDVAEYFFKKGVKNVFITLGSEGVYYNDGKFKGTLSGKKIKAINTTGAGDAFVAALVYCHLQEMSIKDTAIFAQNASILTLMHENTINPNMSLENIIKIEGV